MDYQNQNASTQNVPVQNAIKLNTHRSLLKYIFLSMITLGIYGIVVMCSVSSDINTVASRYDGKKTMNWLLAMILGGFTLMIVPLVWYHRFSDRVGNELARRGINYQISSTTYWGWCILGIFIVVGPFVYFHKVFNAMNLLCEDFNNKGI